jgi:hypothetical protein
MTKIGNATTRNPKDTLMQRSGWDFRRKVEVNQVIHSTKNIKEKYGGAHAWSLSLRSQVQNKAKNLKVLEKNDTIIVKNPISNSGRD